MKSNIPLISVVIIGLFFAGCATIAQMNAPPPPEYQAAERAKLIDPVPGDQVEVVRLYGEEWYEELPAGLMKNLGGGFEILAIPDYPNADEPNHILGRIIVHYRSDGLADEILQQMQAKAGQRGANTLFLVQPEKGHYDPSGPMMTVGIGAYLSDADPMEWPDAQTLLEELSQDLGDYRPSGDPIRHSLDSPLSHSFEAERGNCYSIAFSMEADAAFNHRVMQRFITPRVQRDGAVISRASWEPKRASDRHHIFELGCPQTDGPLVVELEASHIDTLGEGDVLLQPYAKSVSEEELERQAQALDQAYEAAERAREEMAVDDCNRCRNELDACWRVEPTMPMTSCQGFVRCMQRTTTSAADCSFR